MSIIDKKVEDQFHECDICGYDKGFHVSFVKKEESHDVVLICPSCGQRYTVNWRISL